jgi:hypothetical protein
MLFLWASLNFCPYFPHLFSFLEKFDITNLQQVLLSIYEFRENRHGENRSCGSKCNYISLCTINPYDILTVKKALVSCVLRHGIQYFQWRFPFKPYQIINFVLWHVVFFFLSFFGPNVRLSLPCYFSKLILVVEKAFWTTLWPVMLIGLTGSRKLIPLY